MARWAFLVLSILLAVAGVGFRIVELGRFGFWNDEAWVALTTRVETLPQFRLAVAHTPIGFALLLRAVPSSLRPELALRLVPLGFGCACMWLAWRLGRRVAGAVGALVALAVVALDPLGIAFAKQLKQYTAEAALALAALDALQAFVALPSRATRRGLVLALGVGVVFSHAQVLVAGPVVVVAAAFALARGEGRRVNLLALAAVLAWCVVWYLVMIAPHATGELTTFFANDFIPSGTLADGVRFAWAEVAWYLGYMLGPRGWLAAAGALAVAIVVRPTFRPVAAAVVLLLVEMVGLGVAQRVPFGASRVMLFCYAATGCTLAIGVGCVLAALASRPAGRAVAVGLCALLVADVARAHGWTHLGDPPRVEDAGPLVRAVEAARGPDDVVLVYARSLYVYAYYQRPVPVLVPAPSTTGFVPVFPDPHVRLVDRTTIDAQADRAFADGGVVWFVGSRLGDDGPVLQRSLARRGTLTRSETRIDAVLLRFERHTPAPADAVDSRGPGR